MASDSLHREKLPLGIAGIDLHTIERQLPAEEPPALAPNSALRVIGKAVSRLDARAKVTGTARFTADVKLPGMLEACILRSPYPHARVLSIDTTSAEHHPEVRAIHVISRNRGEAQSSGRRAAPGPPTLLYAGAAILAVAATSRNAAEEALKRVTVKYQTLPFVVDMEAARKPGAPLVFDGAVDQAETGGGGGAETGLRQTGNVRGPQTDSPFGGTRGDLDRGFRDAEIVVSGEYRTQVQTHCCLETHCIVADWRTEALTVYISTQDTVGLRDELARDFGLSRNRVRVISDFTGGGFGSKFGAGDYGHAAITLSRKAGAPVRLILDRAEEQVATGNRPMTWQRLRLGAKRDGTLTALSLLSYGSAGVALGAGVGTIAQAMYTCPNFAMQQYDVLMHTSPGCAMRAPGNVQGAFALEQLIDELAEKLKLDPLVLRDRIDASNVRRVERRIGAERFGWASRKAHAAGAHAVKTGFGVAQSFWPGLVQSRAACEVRLLRDGSVEVRSSVQDIGTGIRTVLAQVVAEELGLSAKEVSVRIGDTDFPPGPFSGGSMTTGSITPAARKAAYRVRRRLVAEAARQLGAEPETLVVRDGQIFSSVEPTRGHFFRDIFRHLNREEISAVAHRDADYDGFRMPFADGDGGYARENLGGVQFAEVSVDTETGIVRVRRIIAVHDCGRPINPLQIESQIHGGIVQGLSFALFENRVVDRHSGRMVNTNLEQYKIAGASEVPEIEVILIENYTACSATDAAGVGEPANIATAAAIANAVHDAIGVRITELPMTPSRILATLGNQQSPRLKQ